MSNLQLIERNDNHYESKNNKYLNILNFPLNVFLHILLLSICETILYFVYISRMENEVLLRKIINFLDNLNNFISESNIYLSYSFNQDELINYNNNLREDYDNAEEERKNYNSTLLNKCIYASCTIFIIFIFYFIGINLKLKKIKLKKILIEHIILIFFIGIFEYWFFNNIILKYVSISNEELTYITFNCLMKSLNEKDPELNLNSTLYKNCKI